MNSIYRKATFLTSAAGLAQAPADSGWEVAFAGRSNAGKSSAINALCDQHGLCRTSRTPGRTQLLNFFCIDGERRLVDLPGYGYARVAEAVKERWQGFMIDYLSERRCLRGVVLLMDVRHPLTDYDLHMLDWTAAQGLPTHILLTKADKLNRGPAMAALHGVRRRLRTHPGGLTSQLFSALERQGIEQLQGLLDTWLALPDDLPGGTQ
jgi:GTP-binding protein